MPTITVQPSTSALHPAYGSTLDYTVTQAYTLNDPLPALEVRITINGALFSTQYFQPTSATTTLATFEINLNGVVQEFFDSNNADPGSFDGAVNDVLTNALASISVAFYSWLANASDLLELTGSPATSSTSLAINSAQSDLTDFYAASSRAFLSNKPDNPILKTSEGEIIAIYTTVSSEVIIKTYDSTGLQGEYRKTLDGGATTRIVAIGVGVVNLIALAATGWDYEVAAGGDMMDGGTSQYYTIQVGVVGGSVFSELRTYYIDNSTDCIAYRLYFLNKLGFYDAVSLYGSTLNIFETDSILFETPITDANAISRNRIYSKLENGFTADFKGLADAEQTWLKELANSIDVYEGSTSNPVIVQDTGAVEKDTYAALNELTLEFKYSNQEYSQRN